MKVAGSHRRGTILYPAVIVNTSQGHPRERRRVKMGCTMARYGGRETPSPFRQVELRNESTLRGKSSVKMRTFQELPAIHAISLQHRELGNTGGSAES